jgi:hypothetical protein
MKNVPNEIRKDSINYYTNKLQTTYNNLKKAIYASFIAILLDTLAIFFLPSIFSCTFNIISIIIIIISSILCLYSFRHNFMHVSFNIYVQSKKVLILESIILGFFYVDMFYVLLFRILLDFEKLLYLFEKSVFEIIIFICLFIFYLSINLSFPIFIIFKLTEIRRRIKDLGAAQGEHYDQLPNTELTVKVENSKSIEIK